MRYSKSLKRKVFFSIVALALIMVSVGIMFTHTSKVVQATCPICWCESCLNDPDCALCEQAGEDAIDTLKDQISELLGKQKEFLQAVWARYSPHLAPLTEQLSATSMALPLMVGTFFDAKHLGEVRATLDTYHVDAVRDYQPSTALCQFGTIRRDLAASEIKSDVNHILMAKQAQERHLGRQGRSSPRPAIDIASRYLQFVSVYCNKGDNIGEYKSICSADIEAQRINKDIDITRTLLTPKTLDVDFTDTIGSADEQDIISLARNLYGHKSFVRPDEDVFKGNSKRAKENRRHYHRFRSLIAKKSVMENSFFKIAARKSKGTGFNAEYMMQIAEHLGLDQNNFEQLVGQAPSYDAQMEFLTQTIYQNPTFITQLVDKPANISRQHAAMMSFELMQERDAYDSMRRQEVLLALMLEQLLEKRFTEVNTALGSN